MYSEGIVFSVFVHDLAAVIARFEFPLGIHGPVFCMEPETVYECGKVEGHRVC